MTHRFWPSPVDTFMLAGAERWRGFEAGVNAATERLRQSTAPAAG